VNKIWDGNCLDTMSRMPDNFIDCIITSPPYYQLRKYSGIPDYIWDEDKNCEHKFGEEIIKKIRGTQGSGNTGNNSNPDLSPKKITNGNFCQKCNAWKGQLGLEPIYQIYLNHLLQIMAECKRVLKNEGTMFWNMGDSYAGSSNGSWNAKPEHLGKQFRKNDYGGKYLGQGTGKSNSDIPTKSLMLIPHRFAIRCCDELGLILRNDIIWAKKNGMPESVIDRFSKKHEFFFFFVKQQRYYFDLNKIREKHSLSTISRVQYDTGHSQKYEGPEGDKINRPQGKKEHILLVGKNPGDVSDFWDIPTQSSSEKHYATFNSKLIDKPILAGCPEDGIILDPFCGVGTTLIRGLQLNRKIIGIDGSSKYCEIARKKIENYLLQEKLEL